MTLSNAAAMRDLGQLLKRAIADGGRQSAENGQAGADAGSDHFFDVLQSAEQIGKQEPQQKFARAKVSSITQYQQLLNVQGEERTQSESKSGLVSKSKAPFVKEQLAANLKLDPTSEDGSHALSGHASSAADVQQSIQNNDDVAPSTLRDSSKSGAIADVLSSLQVGDDALSRAADKLVVRAPVQPNEAAETHSDVSDDAVIKEQAADVTTDDTAIKDQALDVTIDDDASQLITALLGSSAQIASAAPAIAPLVAQPAAKSADPFDKTANAPPRDSGNLAPLDHELTLTVSAKDSADQGDHKQRGAQVSSSDVPQQKIKTVASKESSAATIDISVLKSETHILPAGALLTPAPSVGAQVSARVAAALANWAPDTTTPIFTQSTPAAATKVLTIALTPVELGTVTVHMVLRGNALEVKVEAAEQSAVRALQDDQLSLLKSLKSAGYDVEAVSISLADAGGRTFAGAQQVDPAAGASGTRSDSGSMANGGQSSGNRSQPDSRSYPQASPQRAEVSDEDTGNRSRGAVYV